MEQNRFETEVDRNYAAFEKMSPELLAGKRGKVALLRSEAVVGFFTGESDALAAGRVNFPDGLFSVQEVTDRPADLGFFSHAIDTRLA